MATALRSFYRPHKRVTFDNTVVDPKTGELKTLPSMTKQEFKAECDINNVVKQFKPHHMQQLLAMNLASGAYTDLPDSYEFQDALHMVKDAESRFMTVPAKVRDRFGQDPAQFLAFLQDSKNIDEARQLGLATPLPAPTPPVEVKIVSPTVMGGDGGSPPSQAPKAP